MGYTRKRARGRRQARIDDRRYLDPDCKKFNSKIRRKFITRVNWVFKVSEHTQHNNRPSLLVSNRIVWLLPFFGPHLPPSLLGNLSLTPPPLLATRAPTIFSHSILSLFTPSPFLFVPTFINYHDSSGVSLYSLPLGLIRSPRKSRPRTYEASIVSQSFPLLTQLRPLTPILRSHKKELKNI